MSNQQTLEELEKDLKKTIVGFYAPPSTRWNRNYTNVAEWHFIWSQKRTPQLNMEILKDREKMCEIITKEWYERTMRTLKI